MLPTYGDSFDSGPTPPRLSGFSDVDYAGLDTWGRKSVDILGPLDLTSASPENDKGFAPSNMVRVSV